MKFTQITKTWAYGLIGSIEDKELPLIESIEKVSWRDWHCDWVVQNGSHIDKLACEQGAFQGEETAVPKHEGGKVQGLCKEERTWVRERQEWKEIR